jgi:DNA repair exonuclease SbcCD nuclease subunit
MKFIHTSDLQLDAPFAFLGEVGQRHRQQLLGTFDEILHLVRRDNYQLLLISGDLFDSNRPGQPTVDHVVNRLRDVSIPVCILPGNHDAFDSNSIYRRTVFPPNVTIFTDRLKLKVFPELDLAVYGNAVLGVGRDVAPMANLRPSEEVQWHIAMAHGNVVSGLVKDPDRPILESDIASCGMDYVALGDWHGFGDYSQGKVRAFYSGSPEPMAFDQRESGYVAGVSLGKEGVKVEKIRVGKVQARQLQFDVSGMTEADLQALVLDESTAETMLEVTLKGLNSLGTVIDPTRMEEGLAPQAYAIRIKDKTHPQLEQISPAVFPKEHAIGKFVEIILGQIEAAQDEESRVKIERALQLGIALLQGKEVL